MAKRKRGLPVPILPRVAGPRVSYPPFPQGTVIPRSPLGNALIEANLLSIDRGDYPMNSVEVSRQANIPPIDTPLGPTNPAQMGIGSTAYEGLIRGDRRFQELEYQHSQASPFLQQQSNLTGNSLINIPNTGRRLAPTVGPLATQPVNYGNLEGINLSTQPPIVPKTIPPQSMDYYDFEPKSPTSQQILLSPARRRGINPLVTFTHEGRHAIDDLYKRPHQREMVNFLAEQEERDGSLPSNTKPGIHSASRQGWLQPLLEGAQDIIPERSFKRNYPYQDPNQQKVGFGPDVTKSLNTLKANKRSPYIPGFQGAKVVLDRLRTTPPSATGKVVGDTGDAFKSFSEFPAFMMERLNQAWPPFGTPGIPDASRRFAKENLRTMYRDYDELSGSGTGGVPNSLATQYPQVHQAFFDRYNELRNPDYGTSLSSGVSQNPNYLGKTRQEASLEKMGAPPVAPGSPPGTLPVLPVGAPPVQKPALTAFTPGVGGAPQTPNAFPAPKYTNRAKGGHVTRTKTKKTGLFSYFNR